MFKNPNKIHIKDFEDCSLTVHFINEKSNEKVKYINNSVKIKKRGKILHVTPKSKKDDLVVYFDISEIEHLNISNSNVKFKKIERLNEFSIDIDQNSNVEFQENCVFFNLDLNIENSKCQFLSSFAVSELYAKIKKYAYVAFQDKGYAGYTDLNLEGSVLITSDDFFFEDLDFIELKNCADFRGNVLFKLDINFCDKDGCNVFVKGSPEYRFKNESEYDDSVYVEEQLKTQKLPITDFIEHYHEKRYLHKIDDFYIFDQDIMDFEYPYFIQEALEKQKEHNRMLSNPVQYKKEQDDIQKVHEHALLNKLLTYDYPTEYLDSKNRETVSVILNRIVYENDKTKEFEFDSKESKKIQKMCFVLDIDYKKSNSLVTF